MVKAHHQWRYNNDWAYTADKCRSLIRSTINGFLGGGKKFQNLVGCDGFFFRKYLFDKFLPGMTWQNFGRGAWTVGHIKAVAHFKDVLHTESGQQACFHYTNLQSEWERSNLVKHTSDSLTPAQIVLEQRRNQVQAK